jgi:hypothetical protein
MFKSVLAPHTLISDEYEGLFPRRQNVQGVKLATHLHPVLKQTLDEAIPPRIQAMENFTFRLDVAE